VATLNMDKDQTLRLEGKPLAAADLGKELLDLARTRPETGVLVQMHRDLPVQALVELMDKLRAAGISRTAVATSSKAE
jgi:biopolymer transport protein ExbD